MWLKFVCFSLACLLNSGEKISWLQLTWSIEHQLKGKTPYEVLHGHPPIYEQLQVFGCLCYAYQRPRDRDKFATRSRRCLFIGYLFGKKAWRLYDLETNEFIISRDVVFMEDKFPGIDNSVSITPPILQTDFSPDDWLINPETQHQQQDTTTTLPKQCSYTIICTANLQTTYSRTIY